MALEHFQVYVGSSSSVIVFTNHSPLVFLQGCACPSCAQGKISSSAISCLSFVRGWVDIRSQWRRSTCACIPWDSWGWWAGCCCWLMTVCLLLVFSCLIFRIVLSQKVFVKKKVPLPPCCPYGFLANLPYRRHRPVFLHRMSNKNQRLKVWSLRLQRLNTSVCVIMFLLLHCRPSNLCGVAEVADLWSLFLLNVPSSVDLYLQCTFWWQRDCSAYYYGV